MPRSATALIATTCWRRDSRTRSLNPSGSVRIISFDCSKVSPAGIGNTLSSGALIGSDTLTNTVSVTGSNLSGTGADETFTGTSLNDTITGGGGDDFIDGAAGTDTAVFSGNFAQYTFAQGSLIVALSDFYQRDGEWLELLKRLSTGNREVLALCLECQDEIDLGHQGAVRFEDLESGDSVLSVPDEVRVSYRQRREDWLLETEHKLQGSGIQFARFNVDQPMDLALRSLLNLRMRAA